VGINKDEVMLIKQKTLENISSAVNSDTKGSSPLLIVKDEMNLKVTRKKHHLTHHRNKDKKKKRSLSNLGLLPGDNVLNTYNNTNRVNM